MLEEPISPASKRPSFRSVGLIAVLVASVVGSARVFPGQQPEERAFVVGFRHMPRGLQAGDNLHGGQVQRLDRVLHFARVVTRAPVDFRNAAGSDRGILYVEPDPIRRLIEYQPNDPSFGSQYGPQAIRAPEAWDATQGDLDATVCIVDTGVRYTHEDIGGARWLGGIDYVNGDSDPADDNGHGTHVAGTAAAGVNNARGIAGIANVGIRAAKALDSQGSGALSWVASGIRWCADNGGPRTVINLSLGSSTGSQVLQDAVSYAYGKGALLVAAAGNTGPCVDCVGYPGRYPEVMAVTCTDASTAQCSFSSDGPESELAGPGNAILSLWHTSDSATSTISGTSMSSPHVAGAAALAWSQFTALSNVEVRRALRDSARDVGPAGWDEQYGFGLADAKKTLDVAAIPPPPESRVFYEDFNDGSADGWSRTGLWHVSAACTPVLDGNYIAYNEDVDCQYSTGSATTGAAAFDVDLAGKTSATLNFHERYQVESYTGGAYDVMRVEISTNGGSSYSTLRQRDSRGPAQTSWLAQSVDLDTYVGGPVRIRFVFDSIDGTANAFPGWLLDNVEVTASAPGGNQPPIANAGPDQSVADDDASGSEEITLNASRSSDPDGSITSYQWHDGETLLATGQTSGVSLGVGTHTITLTVTDEKGATATDTVVVTVHANLPPTPTFTYTTSGLTLNADGSGSTDPDGTIASYSWNWGDGTPAGSGATATHTYAAGGSYTVTLTATDNGGATKTASQTVTVAAPAAPAQMRLSGMTVGRDDANRTRYTTASFSPPPNSAIVVAINVEGGSNPPSSPRLSGHGLTWSKVSDLLYDVDGSNRGRLYSFFAVVRSSPVSGSVTIDLGSVSAQNAQWSVFALEGVDLSAPVRTANVAKTSGGGSSSSSISVRLPYGAESAVSRVVAVVGMNGGQPNIAPRTNWIEIHDQSSGAESSKVFTEWRSGAFEQTASASWSSVATRAGIIGFEVRPSPA